MHSKKACFLTKVVQIVNKNDKRFVDCEELRATETFRYIAFVFHSRKYYCLNDCYTRMVYVFESKFLFFI